MFEGFSFESASRHPSALETDYDYTDGLSPTSSPPMHLMPAAWEYTSTLSIAELSRRFGAQRIGVDVYHTPTSFFDPGSPSHDEPDWSSTSSTSPTSSSFPHIGRSSSPPQSIRSRRQAHMQWQCDAANVRDLSSLVERMIESGDQCTLRSKSTSSSPSESGEEEEPARVSKGVVPQPLPYKRSGEVMRGAAVSKHIRIRKRPRKTLGRK